MGRTKPGIRVRPGILEKLKSVHGFKNDVEFAHALGTSRATLHRVTTGKDAPSNDLMTAIMLLSGVRSLDNVLEVVRPVAPQVKPARAMSKPVQRHSRVADSKLTPA